MNIALKEKDKQIVFLAAFAVIVVMDLIFILGWQWRSLLENYKSASEKKQYISALEKDIRNLEAHKRELVDLDKKIADMGQSIINEVDFSALIENISNLADSTGVKITQIKPVIETAKENYIQVSDGKLGEMEIRIIAKSDFHQLGNFISRIESAKNFLKLFSLEIITDSKNYFVQNITLSLKTVVNLKQ